MKSGVRVVGCPGVARPPTDTHEWISFEDEEEERTWTFDVSFLASNWTCIFGHGCQGVLTGPAPELVQGCCSYGTHLVDKQDARRVLKAAATLTPEDWQNHGTKKSLIHVNKAGETVTRLLGDACVFLNRPGFPAGAGCAFHIAAVRRGVDPMTLKPEVCWQLPLRREDQVDDEEGHVTSVIRQWDRRHWGKGGQRVPLVVHRGPGRIRGEQAGVPGDGGRAHGDGRRQGLQALRRPHARAGATSRKTGGPPPPRRTEPLLGAARRV